MDGWRDGWMDRWIGVSWDDAYVFQQICKDFRMEIVLVSVESQFRRACMQVYYV